MVGYIVKPYIPVWDIMICKNIHHFTSEEYHFIQEEADHHKEKESAMTVIKYASRYLLEMWTDAVLSRAMLELSLNRDETILDLLKSNLYCVLLLEAMGQTLPDETSSTLTALIQETPLDYWELSKALSMSFPEILEELFVIKEKSQTSDPYQISTRYPELLLAELQHSRKSPWSDVDSTVASYKYNMKFYQGCISAIAPNDRWTKESFAQYYLFERFFRLNAKHTLFWGEYHCTDKGPSVSPSFLADCLFQSPLVLFPHEMLPKLLYEKWGDKPIYERQARVLCFTALISCRWFFVTLEILRNHMRKHDIVSPEDVHEFFFPGSDDFSKFVKLARPRVKLDDVTTDSALQKTYSNRWSAFIPAEPASQSAPHRNDRLTWITSPGSSFRRALIPLAVEDWSMKSTTEYSTPVDQAALAILQDRLF